MICLHARMWRGRIKTRAWFMDFAKPQPECLRSASVSVIFAVVRPNTQSSSVSVCSKRINRCMRRSTASL